MLGSDPQLHLCFRGHFVCSRAVDMKGTWMDWGAQLASGAVQAGAMSVWFPVGSRGLQRVRSTSQPGWNTAFPAQPWFPFLASFWTEKCSILASHSCGLLQRSFHWPLISMLVLFVVSFVVEKSLILMLSNPSGFHFIVGVLRSSFPNHRTTWIVFYDFLYEVFNLFSLPLYVKARFQLYFSPSISYWMCLQ